MVKEYSRVFCSCWGKCGAWIWLVYKLLCFVCVCQYMSSVNGYEWFSHVGGLGFKSWEPRGAST